MRVLTALVLTNWCVPDKRSSNPGCSHLFHTRNSASLENKKAAEVIPQLFDTELF